MKFLKSHAYNALWLAQKFHDFFSLKRKNRIFREKFFFSEKYFLDGNDHQNDLKPEYVVNGHQAHLWFTSDDFLKNFQNRDDFFSKFSKKIISTSKFFQKVIKSYPDTLQQLINNIFRFQNILIVIFESKFISVDFKEKKFFSSKSLMKSRRKIFFLLKIEKSRQRLPSQLYSKYVLNISDI